MQTSALKPTKQRRLILTRHAKAVEEDAGGDHARPLAARGREDAAALGQWLGAQGFPQQVLCSTAARTRETLAGLGETLPTILSDKLYLASAGEVLAMIQASDDAVTDLMVIGHNPGMHGLLAGLVGDYADERDADRLILKFPTAACAVLSFEADSWQELAPHSAKLELLRY